MSFWSTLGKVLNPAGAIIQAVQGEKKIDQLQQENAALKAQVDQQIKDITADPSQNQKTVTSAISGTGSTSTILIGVGAIVLLLVVLVIFKRK